MPEQTLSGLQTLDPSGSTPQPAPLSGLPLPNLFGGMGGDQGMAGTGAAGGPGGSQGGPGLDFFQLMAQLQGQGDSGLTATPPNLSSLLAGIGQGGLGTQSLGQGSFQGFGQAGGISDPSIPSAATGGAGQTGGQLDSIALIKQALGIGQGAVKGIGGLQAGAGSAPAAGGQTLGDFPGTSLGGQDTGTASPTLFQGGDLASTFLNDPMIGQAFQSGAFTGGQGFSPELWDTLRKDPAFITSMISGEAGDTSNFGANSNLLSDNPLGGTGRLQMPDLGGGAGFGLGDVSSGLGGLSSILGLIQGAKNPNPLSLAQNIYGLYSAINNLGNFGGPTLGSLGASLGASLGGDAAATAGSTAAEAAAGASGGAILGGISAIPSVWDWANDFFSAPGNKADAIHRAKKLQEQFSQTAWPAYQATPQTLQDIQNTHDPAALQSLLQTANYQLAQGPKVSEYISTAGGKSKYTPGLDLSQITPVSSLYSMDAVLNNTLAADKLANLGISYDMGPQGLNISDVWSNPQAMLGGLWGAAGMDPGHPGAHSFWNSGGTPTQTYDQETQTYSNQPTPWALTPEQNALFATPGQRLQGIQSIFQGLNPNLASTPLGLTLAQLLGGIA